MIVSGALTASYYRETDPTFTAVSGTFVLTSSFSNFTASYNTGSFSGSFTGRLYGTASWVENIAPAGTANQIIYNNGTALAGDSRLTFDGTNTVIRDSSDTYDAFSTAQNTNYTYTQLPQLRQLDTAVQEDIITSYIQTGELIGGLLSGASAWDLVYLDTDGYWRPVDQSNNAKAIQMLGITDNTRIFIEGYLVVGENGIASGVPLIAGTLQTGKAVYIKEGATSAPFLSTTVPTSGIVRILGHLILNHNTNYWLMRFRPDHTWVEI